MIKSSFLVLFLFFAFLNIGAQELPPLQNFLPKEYAAENQNWAIAQDDSGRMYFANNAGLLTYNGAQWQLYKSPNKSIVRSVGVHNDRIYTGCYMEFGFWERNKSGILTYKSLSETVGIKLMEDEQFWEIHFLDDLVLFQSLDRIYVYDTLKNSFAIVDVNNELTKSFKLDGTIYFQAKGVGLYRIEGGLPILVLDDPVLKDDILVSMFKQDDKIMLVTRTSGLYMYSESGIQRWNIADTDILNNNAVYNAQLLSDGSIVLGTIANGLYQLDKNGEVLLHLNQEKGLGNNTVLSLLEDRDNNLWLGLDNGISLVNFESHFRVFEDTAGKLGTIYAAASKEGNLYIGTNQGLFYKKLQSEEEFTLITGTRGQVWSLEEINGTLFCGHNLGAFIIDKGNAQLISTIPGVWNFNLIPGRSELLLAGTYDGLFILEEEGNNWGLRNKLKGFDISSRFVEMPDTRTVLVSHEYKGVISLKLDNDLKRVEEFEIIKNVPAGPKSALSKFDDNIYYSYEDGVYRYNADEGSFEKNELFSKGIENGYVSGRLIKEPSEERIWGFSNSGLFYYEKGKLNNQRQLNEISFPAQMRQDLEGYENITLLGDSKYLIGLAGGFTILDLEKFKEKTYTISINAIESSANLSQFRFMPLETDGDFKASFNDLRFTYSITEYAKFKTVSYQYRLLGIYENWSPLREDSQVLFENLPHGDYTFEVRAFVGNKPTENIASYMFSIARPWYISIPALIIYSILFLGIVILIQFYNSRHYKKREAKLIKSNQLEFEVAKFENERELMALQNEKLQGDINSKNREVAASTMGILKKNQLLNSIKKDLMVLKDNSQVQSVIKTIDRNLTDKKDREFFEEAFNNADKDFLKKMKAKHDSLTPNDLRLCAYLRLNLSSKEIAPLLNISVRSVEIKRYRLRKKIELPHKKSLVEYILSI